MLIVHRSSSGTALASGLAALLREVPEDPFAAELVAIPAKGVERWLAQRLSHELGSRSGDGVCANVDFPSPRRLIDEALQAAIPEHVDALDRWTPGRLVWPVLGVIDGTAPDAPWFRVLAQHLGLGDEDKGRRFAVASRLAHLFDEYGHARPEMIRAWADGRDERGDGSPLEADLAWQAELWRRVRAEVGVPSPAELLGEACSMLRSHPEVSALPARISIFGASRMSPSELAVLSALAAHRDVHLWLQHASPALWDAVDRSAAASRRADDDVRALLRHPLLASLSRDVLEFQQLIRRCAPAYLDDQLEPPALKGSLLGRLKQGIAADSLPAELDPLDPHDRSVQIHACHGRTRQVEVLREVVLGLLAADPTLEPRDVLVMCPDVDEFAPIIASVFALGAVDGASHPAARLRVRLADRALRQTNSLLATLSKLLDLGTARITASQVLDLAGTPAVRQRFHLDDDGLDRLRGWVVGAGVRWGLSAEHRSTWHLGSVAQGTWHDGFDRLLSGVAIEGGDRAFCDVVPLDDVDSTDIDIAGRFAELLDRLGAAQRLMAGQHTVAEWITGLEDAVLTLAAPASDAGWQQVELHSELADLAEEAAESSAQLGLPDIRALLEGMLAGRPTRASFRTGTLTVCTMVPMRSVPHRVVCLLGIDDGSFPRQSVRDGDDLLARDPWIGERDPRSEDRQLFLDAIGAAQDHLVVTYSGADERTGAEIPPAVPLGELIDALDRTAASEPGTRVRDAITTRHPLQPFDRRNFMPGELHTLGSFSFDKLAFAGALSAAQARIDPEPFLTAPLPAIAPDDIALIDLHQLLEHPARGFLRQRLQLAVTRVQDEPGDALPVELDSLELWGIGERLLSERLAGLTPAECVALELRRGTLPPGPLGEASLRTVGNHVEALLAGTTAERLTSSESHDVDVALGDGTRINGTIAGVHGTVLLSLSYSKLGAKHRLRAWIDLLALTLARPDREWSAISVGRDRSGAQRSQLGPISAEDARRAIGELVVLYRAGLQWPLPVPLKSAAEYARLRHSGRRAHAARTGAEKKWKSGMYPGEQADAEHVVIYGPDASIASLTGQLPWAAEAGSDGAAGEMAETDRFGLLASRLWGRLLAAEAVTPL